MYIYCESRPFIYILMEGIERPLQAKDSRVVCIETIHSEIKIKNYFFVTVGMGKYAMCP